MGLLNKYTTQSSKLAPSDGRTPSQANHEGATKESKLHAYDNRPGYSLNGSFESTVRKYDTTYDNGGAIILPRPSILDLNGVTPAGYQAPEVGIPTDRLQDLTD